MLFCWQLTTDHWQLTYSLLIPCFCTWFLQKPAIHTVFHAREKKFPVIFPVIRNSEAYFPGGCDKTFQQN